MTGGIPCSRVRRPPAVWDCPGPWAWRIAGELAKKKPTMGTTNLETGTYLIKGNPPAALFFRGYHRHCLTNPAGGRARPQPHVRRERFRTVLGILKGRQVTCGVYREGHHVVGRTDEFTAIWKSRRVAHWTKRCNHPWFREWLKR